MNKLKQPLKIILASLLLLILVGLKPTETKAAEITIDDSVNTSTEGQKGPSLVWTSQTTGYFFYVDVTTNDLVYRKTTTGGRTWGGIVTVDDQASTKVSVWYDKWTTGDSGTNIHIGYIGTATASANTVMYRSLDTSGDTFSQHNVPVNTFGAGTGSWSYAESEISLTKARGGNLYVAAAVATGSHGFYRCTATCTLAANWASRAAIFEASVTDGVILAPGGESDSNDILAFFWDYSADEISLKTYDDSGNSVAETSISGSMAENTTYGVQWSAVQRQSDNHVIFAAWSELDAATADLKVWDITNSSSITALTNIITNEAEVANISLMINQTDETIYAAYLNSNTGSTGETFTSVVDAVYKTSTDGGSTWSPQAQYSTTADDLRWIDAGYSITSSLGRFQPVWFNDDLVDIITSYAYIWDGSGNWNTAANWVTDTAPSTSTDWLVFSDVSTSNANFNTSPNVGGLHILPGYTGTITQQSTNTVTLNAIGYFQNDGTFTGGSGDITLSNDGDFLMFGGTFNSTSGNLYVNNLWATTGGTFNAGSGSVGITTAGTRYTYGTASFNNLTFYCPNSIMIRYLTENTVFTVNGDLVFSSDFNPCYIEESGYIEAKGNVSVLGNGWAGNSYVIYNGTGTQTVDFDGKSSPSVYVNKQSGSLAFLSDIYIQTGDLIEGGANKVKPDFVTNSTTVTINSNNSFTNDNTLSNKFTLYNLNFTCSASSAESLISSGSIVTVNNNVTMTPDFNTCFLNGPGALFVKGNITTAGNGYSGDVTITLTGTGNQTITQAGSFPSGTLTIAKTGGTATLGSTFTLSGSGQDLLLSTGVLNLSTFNLTVPDTLTINGQLNQFTGNITMGASGEIIVGSTGIWTNNSTGDISLGASGDGVSNSGYIRLDGGGAKCGDSDSISINTTTATSAANWSGAGTFIIIDTTYRDVNDLGITITTYSSTETSNSDWVGDSGCPAYSNRNVINFEGGTTFNGGVSFNSN